MAKKLTLEMKKQIGKEIAAETKRCALIIKEWSKHPNEAIKRIVEGCPYINFYPYLHKLVTKKSN